MLFSFHPNVLQDDDDGHLLALQIIRDLVDKGGDLFLDQLARLGVISKVSTLAGPSSDDENEEESKPEKVSYKVWNLFICFICYCKTNTSRKMFIITVMVRAR